MQKWEPNIEIEPLVAGDPVLELQSNAISTLANAQVPGANYWAGVAKWLKDFISNLEKDSGREQYVFIDMNPSFSMYTQIALASFDRIIIPATADESSRRGVQNVLSLMYGFELPSEIYKQHNFHSQMIKAELEIPKIHLIVKNRLTQYMKTAKAYESVLIGIDKDIKRLLSSKPEAFTFRA
jgi:cellulose biosynthesis protein BcsQ